MNYKNKIIAAVAGGFLAFMLLVYASLTINDNSRSLSTSLASSGINIDFKVTARDNPTLDPVPVGTPLTASWSISLQEGISLTEVSFSQKKGGRYEEIFSGAAQKQQQEVLAYESNNKKNSFRLKACYKDGNKNKCRSKDVVLNVTDGPATGATISKFMVTGANGAETAMPGETLNFSWLVTGSETIESIKFSDHPAIDLSNQSGDGDEIMDSQDIQVANATYRRKDNGKVVTAVGGEDGNMAFTLKVCTAKKECSQQKAKIKVKKSQAAAEPGSGSMVINAFDVYLYPVAGGKYPIGFSWDIQQDQNFKYLEIVQISAKGKETLVNMGNKNFDNDNFVDRYDMNVTAADYGEKLSAGEQMSYQLKVYDAAGNVVLKRASASAPGGGGGSTNPM